MPDKEIDHDDTDKVVCPYCGYKYSDSWEFQDGDEINCQDCNKLFALGCDYSVSYTTSKMDKCQVCERMVMCYDDGRFSVHTNYKPGSLATCKGSRTKVAQS